MSVRRTVRSVVEMAFAYLGLSIIPVLSRGTIVRMAGRLGSAGFKLSGKTRRMALANLDLAFGDSLSTEEKKNIARRSFQMLALVLLDLFWFARHTRERILKHVEVDPSSEALRRAKPAIAVSGHFGNWEILGQAVALFDPPFLGIAAHIKNSMADRLLTRLRQGGNQRVAYREGAMREAVGVLNEGGRVGFLLDQNVLPRSGGVFVDFFGLSVPMSSAAERLAVRTGLPVILGFCVPAEAGRYTLYSPPALNPSDFAGREGAMTQAIAGVLEQEIRMRPGCWLWMYKRWKFIPPGAERGKFPFYSRPLAVSERKKKGDRI